MQSSIDQNYRLFSAILAKVTRPSNATCVIKYAHVLIYISAGEGSRHFSAFHLGVVVLVNNIWNGISQKLNIGYSPIWRYLRDLKPKDFKSCKYRQRGAITVLNHI